MSLSGCVQSLSASCQILNSSLATLNQGISDFPRLCQVLQNTRHFELIPEAEVLDAQRDLQDEIGPQREELVNRANKALAQLERIEYSLQSKRDLQAVRLQQRPSAAHTAPVQADEDADEEDPALAEQFRVLRRKKERLQYSLNRIQMEAVGRKARMSLAPGTFHS
ncbi:DASH complex subunit spc19 [Savitreella phatthalungensis]